MAYIYEDTVRGEARSAFSVPSSNREVLTETFAQAYEENPIKATQRYLALREDERTGPRLAADSARTRLRDAGMEDIQVSDAGITDAALTTLMERKRVERRRQEVFALAEGGLAQGAARLSVAIATTLADPVSMGLNFVPVVGQARYAKWLAGAKGLVGRAGVRAGVGALEGAAGAALAEVPIYAMRTQEQADYDAVDSLMNVTLGGAIGAGLHTTVGSVGDLFARRSSAAAPATAPAARAADESPTATTVTMPRVADDSMERTVNTLAPHVRQATLRAAVGQAVEGRPIDVETIIATAEREAIEAQIEPAAEMAFRTKRGGSLYQVVGETTQRDKGKSGGIHEGDFGLKERSEQTVYVSAEDAATLGRLYAEGAPSGRQPRMDRVGQDTLRMTEWYGKGDDGTPYGKQRVTDMRFGRRPEVGMHPVEFLPRGKFHIGTEISEVLRRAAPDARTVRREPPLPTDEPEYRAAVASAEASIARDVDPTIEANLKAANEEAGLAVSDAKALAERLGMKFDDADLADVADGAALAERWARAAEIATTCLVRGG